MTQKGYKLKGDYPDGVAIFGGEYAIVYDCKNTENFSPTANDIRALKTYVEDEEKIHKDKSLFGVFIAKSFGKIASNFFYFPVDALLYLLYRKLEMGSNSVYYHL